jgi:glycosyltransferase involved in cell wall biosynthesis
VHVHDDQLLPFLGGLRVPYVVTVHCDWEEFWDADRHPDLAGRNWNLVALSESHRRRFAARGFPMLDVVYNGIDVEEFPCSDRKDDYLLSLSVIAPHKGQATAVEVARAAGQNLVLAGNVGDPDYFARVAPSITHDASGAVDKLAAYRALPGAHRAIVYVGPVDDVQKKPLFAHARALLMPFTMEEPCPLVALEALACGTPVIALDRGPASELVRHGETGYVCRSATEMVEAVRALDRLTSRACRADAEQRFSADAMARAYGRLYERVARERSATRDI